MSIHFYAIFSVSSTVLKDYSDWNAIAYYEHVITFFDLSKVMKIYHFILKS